MNKLLLMFKAFIFKERSFRSLFWLWGVFGTILLFPLIDLLALTSFVKRIPYLADWIYFNLSTTISCINRFLAS